MILTEIDTCICEATTCMPFSKNTKGYELQWSGQKGCTCIFNSQKLVVGMTNTSLQSEYVFHYYPDTESLQKSLTYEPKVYYKTFVKNQDGSLTVHQVPLTHNNLAPKLRKLVRKEEMLCPCPIVGMSQWIWQNRRSYGAILWKRQHSFARHNRVHHDIITGFPDSIDNCGEIEEIQDAEKTSMSCDESTSRKNRICQYCC